MEKNDQQLKVNLDISATTPITGSDGGYLFAQGFILRKVSRFVTGGDEDNILPVPVFYDYYTKKILKESLPTELHEEYKDIIF